MIGEEGQQCRGRWTVTLVGTVCTCGVGVYLSAVLLSSGFANTMCTAASSGQ